MDQIASFPFVRFIHWRSGSGLISRSRSGGWWSGLGGMHGLRFRGHVSSGVVDSIVVRLVIPSKAAAAQRASRSCGLMAVESFLARCFAACWRWWNSWGVIGGTDSVVDDGNCEGIVRQRRSYVAVMPRIVCMRNGCLGIRCEFNALKVVKWGCAYW